MIGHERRRKQGYERCKLEPEHEVWQMPEEVGEVSKRRDSQLASPRKQARPIPVLKSMVEDPAVPAWRVIQQEQTVDAREEGDEHGQIAHRWVIEHQSHRSHGLLPALRRYSARRASLEHLHHAVQPPSTTSVWPVT